MKQWCQWGEDATEVTAHFEQGWCLRCQRLLPGELLLKANGPVMKLDLCSSQKSSGLRAGSILPAPSQG